MTHPDSTLTRLRALRAPHRGGHRCNADGRWYNAGAGARTPCPVSVSIDALIEDVEALAGRVHAAAHDDETSLDVGAAAAGYDLEELRTDDSRAAADVRAGVLQMGRDAIERLCEILDGA